MSLLQCHGTLGLCRSEEKARQRNKTSTTTTTTPEQIEKQTYLPWKKTVHTVYDKDNSDEDEHFVLDSIETTPIAKI